jgi:hypothetical protein
MYQQMHNNNIKKHKRLLRVSTPKRYLQRVTNRNVYKHQSINLGITVSTYNIKNYKIKKWQVEELQGS